MSYYNAEIEIMQADQLRELQYRRLLKMVDYCIENVPYYKAKLKEAGVNSSGDIRSLKDIRKLPFTTKEDLKATYPDRLQIQRA